MENICRICLEYKETLDINVVQYIEIIENLVGIEFDRSPRLPQLICDGCEQKLSNVKTSCALCVSSYEYFLNYGLKQENDESKDDTEIFGEYINIEVLEEAEEEIKAEKLVKVEETPLDTPTSNLLKIQPSIKGKHKTRNITFCKTPKKKQVMIEVFSDLNERERNKETLKKKPLTSYPCCECSDVVLTSADASAHFRKHHPACKRNENCSNLSGIFCMFCFQQFNTLQKKIDHQSKDVKKTRSTDFLYTCSLCHKSGFSLTDYKTHGESEHGTEATYCCNHCSMSYRNFSSFTSHVYVKHKNEQNNVCSECGKSYARKSYLESHYRVDHQGHRDFQCQICKVTFKRSCNLKSHMRVHTGEKPYKCPQNDCFKAYSHHIDLKTHIAHRHTGIFKYNCTVCSKGFVKPSQLKVHMGKHLSDS